MPRPNWDSRPVYHVIAERLDGSELILETYPDERLARERAELLALHLEGVAGVRVSMDRAANTHRRAGRC